MALILRAYPDVPWVFLVRDPVEVIVSHLRQPGAQMVPGMIGYTPAGVEPEQAWRLAREEYCARMLGAFCAAAAEVFDAGAGLGRVLDHECLPAALESVVWPHFALHLDEDARAAMAASLIRDAKHPKLEFSPDGQDKRREATDAVHVAAARWAMPAYMRLLAHRR